MWWAVVTCVIIILLILMHAADKPARDARAKERAKKWVDYRAASKLTQENADRAGRTWSQQHNIERLEKRIQEDKMFLSEIMAHSKLDCEDGRHVYRESRAGVGLGRYIELSCQVCSWSKTKVVT